MALDTSRMGFGLTGALDHAVVRELAPRVEEAGFRTLWINDTPNGDALASLRVAAAVTSRIRLATGVISMDRRPADHVAATVRDRDLPVDRLLIGIGASKPPSPLGTIRDAIPVIRGGLQVPVVVGALGPNMRRLGVQESDGVLLNWLTPDGARSAMADKERDLGDQPDHPAEVALYIRVALGDKAIDVLRSEADRYAAIPSYAANFERLGFTSMETAVAAGTAAQVREGLGAFLGSVDEPVVRAVTGGDTLPEYLALLDAIAG
ncbi:MAG TPA: LLM class flavin-dependent oxidoreductase [Thermomicrobiales bacterium]|nr:LLM class flavin-dependent oxidoreductase [Thermomicrobiales bacterium]